MNEEMLHLVPAPGRRVVDPATRQALPPEGGYVMRTTYWERRLRDGDVIAKQDIQPHTEGDAP